jgi:hypothetical protein
MKKQSVQFPNLIRSLRLLSIPAVILMLLLSSVISPDTQGALADGGDYTIDWVAAAPFTYDHLIGGGAFDDRTIGKTADVVESLQGGDFACVDIVTYLAQIEIDNPAGVETIELTTRFSANTTGQPGAGHIDIVNVAMNYGPIDQWDVNGDGTPDVIGDGPGETDAGILDDGGSTATLVDAYFDPDLASGGGSIFDNPSTSADLVGVITIDDLEAADTSVVVRIDVQLGCTIPSDPTGNMQADVSSARVITPNEDAISVGAQTVPFQGLDQIVFLDFGDLPAAYGLTNLEVDGARHGLSDLFLGNSIDADIDGQESAQADGDDYDDAVNDEDGIVRPTGSNWSDGQGEVLATVSDFGCLTAWLDFTNGSVIGPDDSFDDSFTDGTGTYDELIIDNQLLNPGTTELSFPLPVDAADDALFFARFRLIPALVDGEPVCGDPPGLTGFHSGGEVEDYALLFGPTAVTLAEFEASSSAGVPASWLSALALLGVALLGFAITRLLRFHPNNSKP